TRSRIGRTIHLREPRHGPTVADVLRPCVWPSVLFTTVYHEDTKSHEDHEVMNRPESKLLPRNEKRRNDRRSPAAPAATAVISSGCTSSRPQQPGRPAGRTIECRRHPSSCAPPAWR